MGYSNLTLPVRLSALGLALTLSLPSPAGACPEPSRRALRSMGAEGAGLEELRKQLKPPTLTAGLEEGEFLAYQRRLAGQMNENGKGIFSVRLDEEGLVQELRLPKMTISNGSTLRLLAYNPTVGFVFLDKNNGGIYQYDWETGKQVKFLQPGPGFKLLPYQERRLKKALNAIAKAGDIARVEFDYNRVHAVIDTDPEIALGTATFGLVDWNSTVAIDVNPRSWSVRPVPSRAGLEETPLEPRLQGLFRLAIIAKEEGKWLDLEDVLDDSEEIIKDSPGDLRQDAQIRQWIDNLQILRLELFLNRYFPDDWKMGKKLSGLLVGDLYDLLEGGDQLLRQTPPIDDRLRKQVKVMQAKAATILRTSGDLTEKAQVEKTIVDPEVPRGDAASLLQQLWLVRFIQEKERPAYTRALAYGLINVMSPRDQYLHPSDYELAPDASLIFLQEGNNFPEGALRKARPLVRNLFSRYLWDEKAEAAGQIPEEMLKEALQPNPPFSTLLELAIAHLELLREVAKGLDRRRDVVRFLDLSQELRRQLGELSSETVYLRVRSLQPRVRSLRPRRRPLKFFGPFPTPQEVIKWIQKKQVEEKPSEGGRKIDLDGIFQGFIPEGIVPRRWLSLGEKGWTTTLIHNMTEFNPGPQNKPFWIFLRPSNQVKKKGVVRVLEVVVSAVPPAALKQKARVPEDQPSIQNYSRWIQQQAYQAQFITLYGDDQGSRLFVPVPEEGLVVTAQELDPDGIHLVNGVHLEDQVVRDLYWRLRWVEPLEPFIPFAGPSLFDIRPNTEGQSRILTEKKGSLSDDGFQVSLRGEDKVLIKPEPGNQIFIEVRQQAGPSTGSLRTGLEEEPLTFEEGLIQALKELHLPKGSLYLLQKYEEKQFPLVPGKRPIIVLGSHRRHPLDLSPYPLVVDSEESGETVLLSLMGPRIEVSDKEGVLVGQNIQWGMFPETVSGAHLWFGVERQGPPTFRVKDVGSEFGTAVWIPGVSEDQFPAERFRWDLLPQISLPGVSWNLMEKGDVHSIDWSPDVRTILVLNGRRDPRSFELRVKPNGDAMFQSRSNPLDRVPLPSSEPVEFEGLRMRWDRKPGLPAQLMLENRDHLDGVATLKIHLTKISTKVFHQGGFKSLGLLYQQLPNDRPTLIRWDDLSAETLVNLGGRASNTWVTIRPSAPQGVRLSLLEGEKELYSEFLSSNLRAKGLVEIGRGGDPEWRPSGTLVSRKHLHVETTPAGIVLTDLRTRNGSYFRGVGKVRRMTIEEFKQEVTPSAKIPPDAAEVLLMPVPLSEIGPSGQITVHPYLIADVSLEEELRKVLKEEVAGITFDDPSGPMASQPLKFPGFLVVEKGRSIFVDPWTVPILSDQTPESVSELHAALLAAQALYPHLSMENLKRLLGNLDVVSASVIDASNGMHYLAIYLKEISKSA